jgi:F-type H+-transporting ATPase subunit c
MSQVIHALSQILTADNNSSIVFDDHLGAYIGAGFSMIGACGAGIGQGYAAGRACDAVGRNPEVESKIRTMLIVGCAIAETSCIYALIISIILIFATPNKAPA